ncbi:MAG TPA: L-histidine N(alpha)-methyltransferase [Thermodesulfobacteriota bacterium]|nr:L-histidine N(alpha)-methyltransferase [Thermodesulfobacteriota bacterium]
MNKNLLRVEKYEPEVEALIDEVVEGFESRQKQLPCKLFYDKEGSSLFDEICTLDEYYLTRTERAIMRDNIGAIANTIGKNSLLIELGSGSSRKIRLLLDNLKNPSGYVPIDISEEHLVDSVKSLANDYPDLRIKPVYADYTRLIKFPDFDFPYSRKVVYYPGSTIGNFSPPAARRFMKNIARWSGKGSGLLIGVDLVKDKGILERAYNDGKGVTAKFNLNILKRLNREIGTDFNLGKWEHHAHYDASKNRIEMHLKSLADQMVHVNGSVFGVKKGETILTEYSYKYTLKGFKELVSDSFAVEEVWTDVDMKFSVQYLTVL